LEDPCVKGTKLGGTALLHQIFPHVAMLKAITLTGNLSLLRLPSEKDDCGLHTGAREVHQTGLITYSASICKIISIQP
jgi:hypothetical protein